MPSGPSTFPMGTLSYSMSGATSSNAPSKSSLVMRAVNSLTISSAVTGSPSIAPGGAAAAPTFYAPAMPTARLNGIDVYYERRGDGPPVLFLNGSGSTLDGMRVLLDVFTDRVDLLAHDQRGLGRTEIPPGPYTMADYAADAVALLDHVGWERARVVGISFGGMVAQELSVTVPDRIEKLALLCTSPGGSLASFPLHEMAALDDREHAERYLPLLDTRFVGDWLAEHDSDRALVEMLASRLVGER